MYITKLVIKHNEGVELDDKTYFVAEYLSALLIPVNAEVATTPIENATGIEYIIHYTSGLGSVENSNEFDISRLLDIDKSEYNQTFLELIQSTILTDKKILMYDEARNMIADLVDGSMFVPSRIQFGSIDKKYNRYIDYHTKNDLVITEDKEINRRSGEHSRFIQNAIASNIIDNYRFVILQTNSVIYDTAPKLSHGEYPIWRYAKKYIVSSIRVYYNFNESVFSTEPLTEEELQAKEKELFDRVNNALAREGFDFDIVSYTESNYIQVIAHNTSGEVRDEVVYKVIEALQSSFSF